MKTTDIIRAAALAPLMLGACDQISPDERYIEVPPARVERAVLLEDFTGQGCVNCPAAHRAIEGLENQYGSNLVAVSIHAGKFAVAADNKRYTGLMQPEGQVYNDRYGIDEYPKGAIDGRGPLNSDQWAAAVYEAVSRPTPLEISLAAATDGDRVAVSCVLESSEELAGDLVVWIVESGIVARQEDETLGRIPEYVHNNVFRACVNGIDGVPVSLVPGEPLEADYSAEVRKTDTEKWDTGRLSVVAFVRKGTAVAQAARCRVTASSAPGAASRNPVTTILETNTQQL